MSSICSTGTLRRSATRAASIALPHPLGPSIPTTVTEPHEGGVRATIDATSSRWAWSRQAVIRPPYETVRVGCMPVATRVIACLDVDRGRVVKGVNFENLRDAGDPVELAKL